MQGITIDELRARHTRLTAARQKHQEESRLKDAGFAYVLGELEAMIAELEARTAGGDDATNQNGAGAGADADGSDTGGFAVAGRGESLDTTAE